MFCKRCRYNLKLIASRACPECGRAFDPENPRTYRKRVGMPKFVRRLGKVAVGLLVVGLIALAVIEWRYQQELAAAEVMEQAGGQVEWSDDAHQWAEGIPFLHERLQHVVVLGLTDNQLPTLPPEIGELTKLEWLNLFNNQLTTLPPVLWKLTKLEGLHLAYNQLTTLPPEIGKLTELKWLWLEGNPITDADLEHLKSLKNLETLDLSETKVTKEGVAALKQALPRCVIKSDF